MHHRSKACQEELRTRISLPVLSQDSLGALQEEGDRLELVRLDRLRICNESKRPKRHDERLYEAAEELDR